MRGCSIAEAGAPIIFICFVFRDQLMSMRGVFEPTDLAGFRPNLYLHKFSMLKPPMSMQNAKRFLLFF